MAIDKNKTKELVSSVDELFDSVASVVPKKGRDFLKEKVMGPVFEEIKELISDSRPPVMYLVGRSGHGKSSIINALANKYVAPVGHSRPHTPKSKPYTILFEDAYSAWTVIDSRGIFETTRPDGAPTGDVIKLLIDDMKKHKPDVLMHVISAPEIRNLEHDLQVFEMISNDIRNHIGSVVPTIIVVSKADTLGNPEDWPPENNPEKAGLIIETLDYLCFGILKVPKQNLDLNLPLKGYHIRQGGSEKLANMPPDVKFPEYLKNKIHYDSKREHLIYEGVMSKEERDELLRLSKDKSYKMAINVLYKQSLNHTYIGIIPVCSREERKWNIETLSDFIGEHLPKSALLNFFQAQKRKGQLKKLSSSLVKRFSVIAGIIGTSPIPISDILILIPLQLLMIAIIGGLSCRPLAKKTAYEYLKAGGVNVGAAVGLRTAAQQFIKLIPILGPVISGGIASGGTFALGKAAEMYFFSGEVKDPKSFISDWEKEKVDKTIIARNKKR